MIVIGSVAAMQLPDSPLKRVPRDLDLIGTHEELKTMLVRLKKFGIASALPASQDKWIIKMQNRSIIEFEIAWSGTTNDDLVKMSSRFRKTYRFDIGEVKLAPAEVLLFLKRSHRYMKNSPHFQKTRHDIQMLETYLESQTYRHVPDEELYPALMKRREKETYTYSHPNLKQSKADFFDKTNRDYMVYDHDSIHKAVAHLERPAYEFFKAEHAEVDCSKDLFNACPEHVRLYAVLEEAYVLALERSQIHFRDTVTPLRSFEMALMKVCTSITSGWFREFAYENYDKVRALYSEEYVNKFWTAVDNGMVPKYQKPTEMTS